MTMPNDIPAVDEADVLAQIEAAERVVSDLCRGQKRWTMSIPARPQDDPDLVIGAALHAARVALSTRPTPVVYGSVGQQRRSEAPAGGSAPEDAIARLRAEVVRAERIAEASRVLLRHALAESSQAPAPPGTDLPSAPRCPRTGTVGAQEGVRCGNDAGHGGDCWFSVEQHPEPATREVGHDDV